MHWVPKGLRTLKTGKIDWLIDWLKLEMRCAATGPPHRLMTTDATVSPRQPHSCCKLHLSCSGFQLLSALAPPYGQMTSAFMLQQPQRFWAIGSGAIVVTMIQSIKKFISASLLFNRFMKGCQDQPPSINTWFMRGNKLRPPYEMRKVRMILTLCDNLRRIKFYMENIGSNVNSVKGWSISKAFFTVQFL